MDFYADFHPSALDVAFGSGGGDGGDIFTLFANIML